jgi:hypothetical protein
VNLWRQWWTNHGTKIIGFGSTVVGVITYIDQETIKVIESALGPIWGMRVRLLIFITAGLATAKRGFTNQQKGPPP